MGGGGGGCGLGWVGLGGQRQVDWLVGAPPCILPGLVGDKSITPANETRRLDASGANPHSPKVCHGAGMIHFRLIERLDHGVYIRVVHGQFSSAYLGRVTLSFMSSSAYSQVTVEQKK